MDFCSERRISPAAVISCWYDINMTVDYDRLAIAGARKPTNRHGPVLPVVPLGNCAASLQLGDIRLPLINLAADCGKPVSHPRLQGCFFVGKSITKAEKVDRLCSESH